MIGKRSAVMIAAIAILVSTAGAGPAAERGEGAPPLEEQLESFAAELHLGLSLAAFAAYSPTLLDLRLHAQQLINLIEGEDGPHYVRPTGSSEEPAGLLAEVTGWLRQIAERSLPQEKKERLLAAAKNVATFLDLARDAALSLLDERRLEGAREGMLAVYAYLAAAYEPPCGTAYVPGLWTILSGFGLADRIEGEPHS